MRTLIFLFILLSALYFGQTKKNKKFSDHLIAHAGGRINNSDYTNSKEAFEKSLSLKRKYIEIDLRETSDGRIVGVHEWPEFKERCGYQSKKPHRPLSFSEVRKCQLDGIYQPLVDEDTIKFFKNNQGITLLTDNTQDFELLVKTFDFKERIITEVFSFQNCDLAIKAGFKRCILKTNLSLKQFIKIILYSPYGITINKLNLTSDWDYILLRALKYFSIKTFVHTINNKKEGESFVKKYGSYIYTDILI